jgi:hypothetical protein
VNGFFDELRLVVESGSCGVRGGNRVMRLALDEFIVEAVVSVGVHVLLAQHVQINC